MGLVDSLNDAFNRGVSGTERVLEVGKLKTRVGTLGKTRNELLAALGAVAYEQFRTSSGSVDAFAALGERIRGVEVDIAQTQARLAEIEAGGDAQGMSCASCGHENLLGARFCVKCGGPLEAPPVKEACSSCGAELPDGGRFCVRCGTPAAPASAEGESSSSEEAGQL